MAPVVSVQRETPIKKALLVAVSYKELHEKHPTVVPQLKLPGTVHDPPKLKTLLIDHFGYDEKEVVILMDDGKHDCPTREKMLEEMKNLAADARAGDRFVFSFSGHGSQVTNNDGTEEDGMDEVIWPSDVTYNPDEPDDSDEKVTGFIKDDDLKKMLVDILPPGAHMSVLLDCCHSGTALDLPYIHTDDSHDHLWSSPTSPVPKSTVYSEEPNAIRGQATPIRGMSVDSMHIPSRSSTMDTEKTKHIRGIARNMRMPFSTRGVVASNPDGDLAVQTEAQSVNKKGLTDVPPEIKGCALSWSACMDDQLSLDCNTGGILTGAFAIIIDGKEKMTNRQMLLRLSEELLYMGKKAKPDFKKRDWVLPQPKPCLGSSHPLEVIFDKEFTL